MAQVAAWNATLVRPKRSLCDSSALAVWNCRSSCERASPSPTTSPAPWIFLFHGVVEPTSLRLLGRVRFRLSPVRSSLACCHCWTGSCDRGLCRGHPQLAQGICRAESSSFHLVIRQV